MNCQDGENIRQIQRPEYLPAGFDGIVKTITLKQGQKNCKVILAVNHIYCGRPHEGGMMGRTLAEVVHMAPCSDYHLSEEELVKKYQKLFPKVKNK